MLIVIISATRGVFNRMGIHRAQLPLKIIILNLRDRVVGIVVDSVSDVMELSAENIRSAPDVESAIDNGCILGLGSVGERMLILLDIEKLMSNADMGLAANDE